MCSIWAMLCSPGWNFQRGDPVLLHVSPPAWAPIKETDPCTPPRGEPTSLRARVALTNAAIVAGARLPHLCEAERQRPASNSWQSRRKIKDAANTIGLRATRRCLRNEKVILAAFTAVFTVLVWAFWKRCYLYLLVLFDGCWREGAGGDTKEERECND